MPHSPTNKKQSVAVVGSGISGLASAFLLQRSGDYDVTIYERNPTPGGHSLTDTTVQPPVDLGFQVYNLTTYPHLQSFFRELGVPTEPSDMSFSLSVGNGRLEWASHNAGTVFAQKSKLLSPQYLRMVKDIVSFKHAIEVLEENDKTDQFKDMTAGEYLEFRGYSDAFTADYLAPMIAAVWSCSNTDMLAFPIRTLVRFWKNHHLIDALGEKPIWRVCSNRSDDYVQKAIATLPKDALQVNSTVETVQYEGKAGVTLTVSETGFPSKTKTVSHDLVIFATHSDITLKILTASEQVNKGTLTSAEKDILSAIKYSESDVYLHSDPSFMPKDKKCWASWNVLDRSVKNDYDAKARTMSVRPVECTYWLNHLQHLPGKEAKDYRFCTLNPAQPPAKEHIIRRLGLWHPLFDKKAVEAQGQVHTIQGGHQGRVFFAGAWTAYGFHEDGIQSAVKVVNDHMEVDLPWPRHPKTPSPEKTWGQSICLNLFDKFAQSSFSGNAGLKIMLPDGTERVYGDSKTAPTLRVLDWQFFVLLVTKTDIGLGEAFMDGMFEAGDRQPGYQGYQALLDVLMAMVLNAESLSKNAGPKLGVLNWIGEKFSAIKHAMRANTIAGSSQNIKEHYDLGNSMYKLFLDKSMTYSAGIYRTPTDSLYQSQLNKLDALIAKAELKATDRVLEIGCGWGSLAIRAVQTTGCSVMGITLSEEQLEEARVRVKAAGLEDKIELKIIDYRLIEGNSFDKVLSCEMLEAVGHEFLGTYFQSVSKVLKPGGLAAIQVISMPDDRYEAYTKSSDFIREHIFPGGHLPCLKVLTTACTGTPLEMVSVDDIGLSYAITLEEWRKNFAEQHDAMIALGYSEQFFRKWLFYFAYCEAGFTAKYIHDFQLVYRKTDSVPQGVMVPPPINLLPVPKGTNTYRLAQMCDAAALADSSAALAKDTVGTAARPQPTGLSAFLARGVVFAAFFVILSGFLTGSDTDGTLNGFLYVAAFGVWFGLFALAPVLSGNDVNANNWVRGLHALSAAVLSWISMAGKLDETGSLSMLGPFYQVTQNTSIDLVHTAGVVDRVVILGSLGFYFADLVVSVAKTSNIATTSPSSSSTLALAPVPAVFGKGNRLWFLTMSIICFWSAVNAQLCFAYLVLLLVSGISDVVVYSKQQLNSRSQLVSQAYHTDITIQAAVLAVMAVFRVFPHALVFYRVLFDQTLAAESYLYSSLAIVATCFLCVNDALAFSAELVPLIQLLVKGRGGVATLLATELGRPKEVDVFNQLGKKKAVAR